MSFLVTPAELNRRAELYNQLGAMIAAGVPLVKALEMTGNSSGARGTRRTILQLIENLQAHVGRASVRINQVHALERGQGGKISFIKSKVPSEII